jgi:hypothetical protein
LSDEEGGKRRPKFSANLPFEGSSGETYYLKFAVWEGRGGSHVYTATLTVREGGNYTDVAKISVAERDQNFRLISKKLYGEEQLKYKGGTGGTGETDEEDNEGF